MLTIRVDAELTNPDLPVLRRDRILNDDNDGVRHLIDLDYGYCWPGGAPADESVIKDIAERGDGTFQFSGSGSMSYAGRGFNFGNIVNKAATIEVPSHVTTELWGAGTGLQYFMQIIYAKLPSVADWLPGAGLRPLSCFTDGASGFSAEADLLTIGIGRSSGGAFFLRAVRQKDNAGGLDQFDINMPTDQHEKFCQLAFIRDANGQRFSFRTASTFLENTKTVNAANTFSFSAKTGHMGIANSFWANDGAARHFSIYRSVIEDLAVSGRDAITVRDEDWDRTIGRGVFS